MLAFLFLLVPCLLWSFRIYAVSISTSYGPVYDTLYTCDSATPPCNVDACGNATLFVQFSYTIPLSGLYTFATDETTYSNCPNTVLLIKNGSYSLCNNDITEYNLESMIQAYFEKDQVVQAFVGSYFDECPPGLIVGFRALKAYTLLPVGYIPPGLYPLYSCDSSQESLCQGLSCGSATKFTVLSYQVEFTATYTISTDILTSTCLDTILIVKSAQTGTSYCNNDIVPGTNLKSQIIHSFSYGDVLTIFLGSHSDSCASGSTVGVTISKTTTVLQLPRSEDIPATYQPLYACDTSEQLCNVPVCGSGGSKFAVYNYTIPSTGYYTFATDKAPGSTCFDTILIVANKTSSICDDDGGEQWFSLTQGYFSAGENLLAYVASYKDTCLNGSLVGLRVVKLQTLPSVELGPVVPLSLYTCDGSKEALCNFTCGGATKFTGAIFDVPISGNYTISTSSSSCSDTVLVVQNGNQIICNNDISSTNKFSSTNAYYDATVMLRVFVGSHNNICASGSLVDLSVQKSSPTVVVEIPSTIDVSPIYQTLYSCDTTNEECMVQSCSPDGHISTKFVVYDYLVPYDGNYIFATNQAANSTCLDTMLILVSATQTLCDDDDGTGLTSQVQGDFLANEFVRLFVGSYADSCASGLSVALRVEATSVVFTPTASPSNAPSLTPTVPHIAPSGSPSIVPSFSPTRSPFPTSQPTKTPTMTQPTLSPSTITPTLSPTHFPTTGSPTPFTRMALFVQADHSGSIRLANQQCRLDSNLTCIELQLQFIQNLVGEVVGRVGIENFRFHLSTFTCLNGNIENTIHTKPDLTAPGRTDQIINAFESFQRLGDRRMYFTCPSGGAQAIINIMQKLPPGYPRMYVIVTDGRINAYDDSRYKGAIINMKKQLQYGVVPCAATIGNAAAPQLRHIMRSNCVESAMTFQAFAQPSFATKFATTMFSFIQSGVVLSDDYYTPTPSVRLPTAFPTSSNAPTSKNSTDDLPQSLNSTESGFLTSDSWVAVLMLGLVFVFLLIVWGVISVKRRRNRLAPRLEHGGETFIMENPILPDGKILDQAKQSRKKSLYDNEPPAKKRELESFPPFEFS